MSVYVRELRAEDGLRVVLDLCKAFLVEYETHHEEFFDTIDLRDEYLSERFLDSITSDRSSTLVALVGDAIVGYASITVRNQPSFYKITRGGNMSGLMVAPAFRRRGTAAKLLAEASIWFRKKGVKYFTISTATKNDPALKLYQGSGIRPLCRTLIGEV